MGQYDEEKARQKIIAVLARMVVLPPEMVKADVRFQDMLNTDPSAMREFALQVEKSLGVTLNDSALSAHPTIAELATYCAQHLSTPRGVSAHPTIAELATYCAQHLSTPRGERLYVVVSRMPDGSTRERIYAARGHEKAAQLAMDDGAAAVLSVEREDAEDGAPSGHGATYKVLVPLLWGLFIGGAVFVFFWWRRGFEKFW